MYTKKDIENMRCASYWRGFYHGLGFAVVSFILIVIFASML